MASNSQASIELTEIKDNYISQASKKQRYEIIDQSISNPNESFDTQI